MTADSIEDYSHQLEEVLDDPEFLIFYDLGLQFIPQQKREKERICFLTDGLKMHNWVMDYVNNMRHTEYAGEGLSTGLFSRMVEYDGRHNNHNIVKEFLQLYYPALVEDCKEHLHVEEGLRGENFEHLMIVDLAKRLSKEKIGSIVYGELDGEFIDYLCSLSKEEFPSSCGFQGYWKQVVNYPGHFFPSLGTNGRVGSTHTGKIQLEAFIDNIGFIQ